MEVKARNTTYDFVKGIACILVILIHFPFPGELGRVCINIARIAVPLFFGISGYYLLNSRGEFELKKKLKGLMFPLALALTLAIVYNICLHLLNHESRFENFLKWKEWVKFFLLNNTFLTVSTWFIYALIYIYVIYFFIKKWRLFRLAYVFSFVILFIHILTRYYASINHIVELDNRNN